MFPAITQLLAEVTVAQAEARFGGKKFKKASARAAVLWRKYTSRPLPEGMWEDLISNAIPHDIPDGDKGNATNWLISCFIKASYDEQDLDDFYNAANRARASVPDMLELFFQMKQLNLDHMLKKNSLHAYGQDFRAFLSDVEGAEAEYMKYQEKKSDEEADGFMNLIGETPEWEVYIPESKGAACRLGKGTKWCTAGQGLNYYHDYHEDHNPLIILKNKRNERDHVQVWFDVDGWEETRGPNRKPPEPVTGAGPPPDRRPQREWEPQFMDVNGEPLKWSRQKEILKIVKQFKNKLPRELRELISWEYFQ